MVWKNGHTGRMRKGWAFSFVALGLFSLLGQVVLLREILGVLYGNEFFIGWTLFAWLLWTGLGAWAGGRGGGGGGQAPGWAARCPIGAAVLLPAVMALVRAGRLLPGRVPGAIPDMLPALFLSGVVLAPVCVVLGVQFVLSVRACQATDAGRTLGRAYALETAGFVIGGLLYSFVLVRVNGFRVAAGLGALNVLASAAMAAAADIPRRTLRLALPVLGGASVLLAVLGGRLEHVTSAWRYPGQELLKVHNSLYGNLAVTRIGAQVNFHENGFLLGAAEEPLAAEQLVHYPMLWHPAPRRVLLIGGGFNGALAEILKHDPEQVDYLELDPALVGLARRHLSSAGRAALDDPRVCTVFADGRFHLHETVAAGNSGRYDAVIVNLPNPGTVLINRFYSLEFFREVRRHLAPGGVLGMRLAFAPDYLSRELEDLGASIHRTLRSVFAAVSILPEYEILYLATAEPVPPPAAAELIHRYQVRSLQTDFVIPPAIEYRLSSDRIRSVRAAFDANPRARLNRDARPIACYYQFVQWLSSFHPRLAALAGHAGRPSWRWAISPVVLLAFVLVSARRRAHRLGAWAMGIGSFSLMTCELAILLAFQVFRGYLYYKIALVIAALMLGMALGTAAGTRRLARATPCRLAGIHVLLAGYAAGLLLFIRELAPGWIGQSLWLEWAFLLLAAAIGALVGYEFPVANRIYLGPEGGPRRNPGTIYALDLVGSCVAALLAGLWLLPVLGMIGTLGVLAGLNAALALLCLGRN